MNYLSMSLCELLAEIGKKEKEVEALKKQLKSFEDVKRNLEIVGRQNRRLKKDNERYRRILDKKPKED